MLDNEAKKKERDQLIRQYYAMDKAFEDAKTKRNIIAILAFSLVYFLLLYSRYIHGIKDFVEAAVVSIVLGGIHFFANAIVFSILAEKAKEENDALAWINKRIRELENCDSN